MRHFSALAIIFLTLAPALAVYNTSECTATQFFDTTQLGCDSCQDFSSPSSDGYSCECNEGYKLDEQPNIVGWKGTCNLCPAGEAPSTDGTRCVACPGNVNANTNDCECGAGEVPIDVDITGALLDTKQCVACDEDALPGDPTTDRITQCVRCPKNQVYSTATSPYTCVCADGYSSSAGTCVADEDLSQIGSGFQVASAQRIEYFDLDNSDASSVTIPASDTIVYLYEKAVVGCIVYGDPTQCQVFANLCVLTLYNRGHTICRLYENTVSAINLPVADGSDNGFVEGMPWLYYLDNSVEVIEESNLALTVGFSGSNTTTSRFQFYVAKYNMTGGYLGFEELTNQILLCPNSAATGDLISTFGTSFELDCTVNLNLFLDTETIFYELFLQDDEDNYTDVPVKITNLRSSDGTNPNDAEGYSDAVFTRRFFMVDTVSGIESDNGFINGDEPVVLRYAKSATLKVIATAGSSDTIYRPYMEITYRERQVSTLAESSSASISYDSSYELNNLDSFWDTVIGLFVASNVIILVAAVARTYIWAKNNPSAKDSHNNWFLASISSFLINLVATWGDFMFFFLMVITGYWFIFFKLQDTLYFLIPDTSESGEYLPFRIVFGFVATFEIIKVAVMILRQAKNDIFFLDWEKPKLIYRRDQNTEAYVQSVWRMLFIANEYNELQTVRHVSMELMYFVFGCLMYGADLENLAAVQPNMNTTIDSTVKTNFILKYFLSVFLLFVIGCVLYGIRKAISLWVPTPIQDFTDLCSISNISIFILDDNYHGYYVHGQSPSGQSEGSAEDLRRFLETESKGIARRRGLDPNDETNLQTYELYIPKTLRDRYNMLYNFHLNKEIAEKSMNNKKAIGNKAIPKGFDYKAIEARRTDLQNYLKFYIEGVVSEASKLIRDKGAMMRLLGVPPVDLASFEGSPLFFKDPGCGYSRIIFLGHEFTLIIFDITMYAMWDLIFSNTFVAIVFAYFTARLFYYFRAQMGEKNLSKKTMIDERFLI